MGTCVFADFPVNCSACYWTCNQKTYQIHQFIVIGNMCQHSMTTLTFKRVNPLKVLLQCVGPPTYMCPLQMCGTSDIPTVPSLLQGSFLLHPYKTRMSTLGYQLVPVLRVAWRGVKSEGQLWSVCPKARDFWDNSFDKLLLLCQCVFQGVHGDSARNQKSTWWIYHVREIMPRRSMPQARMNLPA